MTERPALADASSRHGATPDWAAAMEAAMPDAPAPTTTSGRCSIAMGRPFLNGWESYEKRPVDRGPTGRFHNI